MPPKQRRRKKVQSQDAARESAEVSKQDIDAGFEPRDGDRLVVTYSPAKFSLQGTYSSVELDGATFSRSLQEGDDIDETFDAVYSFLARKCKAEARAKLEWFVTQFRNASKK